MNGNDLVRLRQMLDAAREALSFAEGRSSADPLADRIFLPESRAERSGIPWPVIVGIGNRLIHAYFEIDVSIVRATLTTDLPELVRELKIVPAREI